MDKDSVGVFSKPIWAIVELMERNITAGLIQSVPIAGTEMLRVDVPSVDDFDGYTKFYGGTAIYAITPTDEESARHVIDSTKPRAISEWTVPVKTIRVNRQISVGLAGEPFEGAYLVDPEAMLDDDDDDDEDELGW